MSLLTIAYPTISDKDYQWIQEFREENDERVETLEKIKLPP